ncbi:MAG TPA: MATE family efflux transporter [Gemmatimonadaceae bacterium]|nr:MATE family efflux transporter [Gemmatimonadaceae bacterium]
MTITGSPEALTRPSDPRAAALPLEPHEGLAPVAVPADAPDAARLVSDPLPRTIARIAMPAVASTLLMTIFASVDAYWVGAKIGAAGIAAVATSVFWVWLIISVAEMVSVGLTAVAARRYGEGRREEAARTAGSALVFTLVSGTAIALVGHAVLPQLFAVMHTPPEVTSLGMRYLGTYLIGTPLIFGFFAVDAAFRAAGDARTPFILLAVSVAVTLVLDPVLIMGLGPAPRLGIAGAAIATVTTRSVAFALGLMLVVRGGQLHIGRFDRRAVLAVCRVGLPTAATGVMFSVIYVFITRSATPFGTPALAALGIGHRVESWLYMIGVGFGAATAAIVGQNLGAGRADRAARAGWMATAFCSGLGVVFFVLQLTIPEHFSAVFTSDPAVIREGANYLRIAAVSELAICAEVVLEGALGGAGHTLAPMLSSTTITAARVPLAAWAAWRWGTTGIWWVISITATARGLAMMSLWRAGGWKRRSV